MDVVALPGRSRETEVWLNSLLRAAHHPAAKVIRYRHWDTDVEADVAFEAKRLYEESPQLVVAKSLGTVIAATAHGSNKFRPAFAVFIGTPFAALQEQDIRLLRQFAAAVPTLFIQQAQDPGGPAGELAGALQLRSGNVVEVPGNDHLYLDIDALAGIMRNWEEQQLKI
jgi:alpha-beta hydrolase superfamily lysophospholipase